MNAQMTAMQRSNCVERSGRCAYKRRRSSVELDIVNVPEDTPADLRGLDSCIDVHERK